LGLERGSPSPPLVGRVSKHCWALLSCVVGGCFSQSGNGIRLRSFLTLDNVELNVVALFERFIAIQLDCRVMDENIRPVITSDESVALGVVEPLDFAFELSHRVLPFLPLEG